MTEDWRPGKVVVLGAGAMGGLFGATLCEGGLDVTLVDVWREHVDVINASGLTLTGHGGERVVPVRATTNPDAAGTADLVCVQCKALHTEGALRRASGIIGEHTVVVSFQNGLGNEEAVGRVVGPSKVLAGVTAQGATVTGPGVVHNFGDLPTWVGEPAGGLSARVERIADAFTAAGLDTRASADIRREKWKKLLANVGMSALSAITDLTSIEIMSMPELAAIVHAAVDEAAAVGKAAGVDLDVDETRAVLARISVSDAGGTGASKSSACADIRNRRRTEVDFISGAIVRLGREHGVPTPVNQTLVAAVKGIESHFG